MAHGKTIRHFHEPGHLHEFTFSCYRRMPLLTNDVWREHLSHCIDVAVDESRFDLVAFVYMPERLHLLVYPREPVPNLGRFLALVKQPLSKFVKASLEASNSPLVDRLTIQERPGKTCFRFWQAGAGYDRNLTSPAAIASSLDYIHNNPVKRKLCERAVDWKWSSAGWYLAEPPKQQEPELPQVHGLPAGYD